MAGKGFRELKDEVIRNGGFHVNLYFDLHGNSKDSLKELMVGFVGKLTNEDGVRFGVGQIEEPIAHQDVFSSTAKVTILAESFSTLVKLCTSYGPIGVEIEDPLDVRIPIQEAQESLLLVSSVSQQFTNIMLKKGMTDAEKADFEKKMVARMELGKKLLEDQQK
jgi:hypothetical protein